MSALLRAATSEDVSFLWEMLYQAAYPLPDLRAPPPFEEFQADGYHDRYIKGWGRDGDIGFVAESGGTPVGAAWTRLFTDDEPPHGGFLGADVPLLSIAVTASSRASGVGTALLEALRAEATARGFRTLSLSVAGPNPAKRLYERVGFKEVKFDGGSWTMRLDL